MVSSISWVDVNWNFCARASARPVLMPQSHFLSVPPRDCGIETTIAKDARVWIRNNIAGFIAFIQSQNWRGRVDESLFCLGGNWHSLGIQILSRIKRYFFGFISTNSVLRLTSAPPTQSHVSQATICIHNRQFSWEQIRLSMDTVQNYGLNLPAVQFNSNLILISRAALAASALNLSKKSQ